MPIKKPWSFEEDSILIYLRQTEGIKKWSLIADKMKQEFFIKNRNQKQCRQRYYNHLDSSIETKKLSQQDQNRLFQLHDQIGNKWSIISSHFPGRPDNFLKNFFHSKLRGAIRKLNRAFKYTQKHNLKHYPFQIAYRLVQSCHSKKYAQNQEFLTELKNSLIEYGGGKISKSLLSGSTSKEVTVILKDKIEVFQRLQKNEEKQNKEKGFIEKASDSNYSFLSPLITQSQIPCKVQKKSQDNQKNIFFMAQLDLQDLEDLEQPVKYNRNQYELCSSMQWQNQNTQQNGEIAMKSEFQFCPFKFSQRCGQNEQQALESNEHEIDQFLKEESIQIFDSQQYMSIKKESMQFLQPCSVSKDLDMFWVD